MRVARHSPPRQTAGQLVPRHRTRRPKPRHALRLWLVAAVAALCACDRLAVTDAAATTPPAVFDQVWSDFDRYYAFFESNGVDWNAARTVYRPQAVAARTDQELAGVIGSMLVQLHDQHVTLYTPFGEYADSLGRRPGFYNLFIIALYVSTTTTTGGHMAYGRMASDVGYVRIPSFLGADWADEIDQALATFKGFRGVVVDIRGNGGGSDQTARRIAGRFLSADRLARYLRYRNGPAHGDFSGYIEEHVGPAGPGAFQGKVVLLTDRRSYSAAESFVLYLRGAPGVTVVGDSTGGASGRPIARELANGWTYRLSSWQEFTPDKVSYERVGLAPDVWVPGDSAALRRGFDRQLEAALRTARQ